MKLSLFPVLSLLLAVNARPVYQSQGQSQFTAHSCSPAKIDTLVVFGDSFSDTGNVLQLSNNTWPQPSFYPGGRFTNGPNWTDYVAKERHLNLTNFAHGGATTDSKVVQGYSGSSGDLPVPGFIQQIERYYQPGRSSAGMDSSLFVVSFQGNDFLFDTTITTETVLANIERGIHQLVDQGARHILVVENMDFGTIPYFQSNQTHAREMTALAEKEHREYQDMIRRLERDYGRPGRTRGVDGQSNVFVNCRGQTDKTKVNIAFFDLFAFSRRLSHPRRLQRLGITDVVHGCVSADAQTGCARPEKHYYYDPYHATTKIHREISRGILEFL
ncbi:hypothetical protein BGX29_010574 [Mortierella sp. GBA35]|nr:hypothetical protein BGX29_010574 [Mortierella sp. GBA35]KAF9093528.1 hypothetical protein BGX23_003238 [Mortierella sp. AD031]